MLTSKPAMLMNPSSPARNTVARFDDYQTSQRTIDAAD